MCECIVELILHAIIGVIVGDGGPGPVCASHPDKVVIVFGAGDFDGVFG